MEPTEASSVKPVASDCVIVAVHERGIDVACENALEDENDISASYVVIKITSNVTFERSVRGLDLLENVYDDTTHPSYGLVKTLFADSEPRFEPHVKLSSEVEKAMRRLNDDQKQAVLSAISAKELAVIHGPPGTGKTHTLISYITAEVLRGSRVLVTAPSNVAIDNIAERLAKEEKKCRFVRMGHPARIIPAVSPFSMENQILKTDDAKLAQDIRAELDSLDKKYMKTKDKNARRSLRIEQRQLRKDLRKRERRAVRDLLNHVDVVLATISGTGSYSLGLAESERAFDVIIIDEAAQALEAACWIALLRGKKAVLAGDPYQLGGTVKNKNAEAQGLKRSILDRVFEIPRLNSAISMLRTQYRMNASISTWSSDEFYEGNLLADVSVSEHEIIDLETWNPQSENEEDPITHPFTIIDTAGGDCEEGGPQFDETNSSVRHKLGLTDIHASRHNKGEAEITTRVVEEFLQNGVSQKDIGVISPYSGQVELLRRMMWPTFGKSLEISTIDSFQGREKEVVCISLVRSNEAGEVGFLSDERRMNVAITRARRCVVLICDSETMQANSFLSRIVEYAEENGDYRAAVVDFADIVGTISHQRRPREAIEAEQKIVTTRDVTKTKKGSVKKANEKSITGTQFSRIVEADIADTTDPMKDRLQDEINRFIMDKESDEHIFSSNLTAQERRIVHELAEETELLHVSVGQGNERRLKLSKPSKMQVQRDVAKFVEEHTIVKEDEGVRTSSPHQGSGLFSQIGNAVQDDSDSEESETKPTEDNYTGINTVLKAAAEARAERNKNMQKNQSEEGQASTMVSNNKKKGRRRKKKQQEESDDDFDAILAKYGGPSDPTAVRHVVGPAGRIANGVITTPVKNKPKDTRAHNRLTQKLANKADQRRKKTKKEEQ